MGSVNPVFLLSGALRERGETIARGYADSLTLGVGQFCTNPGVVVGLAGSEFDAFLSGVAAALQGVAPGLMLTDDIRERFEVAVAARAAEVKSLLATADVLAGTVRPAFFATTGQELLANPELAEEVFGPAGLAVRCESPEEMGAVARALQGQLTATIHMAGEDSEIAGRLLPILVDGVGRVVFNGFPTGVEVGPAMQHGGPYPATTDPRSTSVGTAAILRFARPVAFQNSPQNLLPEELRDDNPRQIWRLVDGSPTHEV